MGAGVSMESTMVAKTGGRTEDGDTGTGRKVRYPGSPRARHRAPDDARPHPRRLRRVSRHVDRPRGHAPPGRTAADDGRDVGASPALRRELVAARLRLLGRARAAHGTARGRGRSRGPAPGHRAQTRRRAGGRMGPGRPGPMGVTAAPVAWTFS